MYQKYFVKLTSEERQQLEKLISSGTSPARKLTRARVLLKSDCSEGGPNWSYDAICDAFDVNSMTVTNIRKSFTERGLAQTLDRKKPEREYARSLDGNAEAHLIALACGAAPDGYERWSLRLLKERCVRLEIVSSISHETIRTTLKKKNLSLG